MNTPYSVLFYSKYSGQCTNLLNKIENSDISIFNMFDIKKFCIDNKKVRSRIKNNNKLQITKVPVIITVRQDDIVEKYEGNQAFQWVDDLISRVLKTQTQKEPDV